MPPSNDNKRIAKNAIALYIRMLITLLVSLYTSRVVLETLGIDDFGIFGVVGGVTALFAVVGNGITIALNREITYEVGRAGGNIGKALTNCLVVIGLAALAFVILAETIGLWFVANKLNLPPGSLRAAMWTYQLSVAMCIMTMLRYPYLALILAFEEMNFYALISIIEVLLKLVVLYLLVTIPGEKLIVYSWLITIVTFLSTLTYITYCRIRHREVGVRLHRDKQAYLRVVSLSGWTLAGGLANVGMHQGVNILINLFWGVAVNAAVSIANQVNTAVMQFVSNFQNAFNPQLIKAQASGDKQRQLLLISKSAKFSVLILTIIAFPLIMNMPVVLKLWLGTYPEYTVPICSFIITAALIETMTGPLCTTIFATGKVKAYQLAISLVLLLNLPIDYLLAKLGCPPWSLYLTRAAIFGLGMWVRLHFTKKLVPHFNISQYFRLVIIPLLLVTGVIIALGLTMNHYIGRATDFGSLCWQTILYVAVALGAIAAFGVTTSERAKILNFALSKLHRN